MQWVLYGIFPVIAGGMVAAGMHVWWVLRPAKRFRGLDPGAKLAREHRLDDFNEVRDGKWKQRVKALWMRNSWQHNRAQHPIPGVRSLSCLDTHKVETLSRVVRKFDIDGVVDEDAAMLAETIIKVRTLFERLRLFRFKYMTSQWIRRVSGLACLLGVQEAHNIVLTTMLPNHTRRLGCACFRTTLTFISCTPTSCWKFGRTAPRPAHSCSSPPSTHQTSCTATR